MTDTILLVDDDPLVTSSLRRLLREDGYEVAVANSPVEAIALLEQGPVDAVVSDHQMAELDGVDLLALVHRRAPSTVRFLLTGHATLDVAMAAINKGAVHRLFTKPCDPTDLRLGLHQALRRKSLEDCSRELVARFREQESLLATIERLDPAFLDACRASCEALADVTGSLEDVLRELDTEDLPAEPA